MMGLTDGGISCISLVIIPVCDRWIELLWLYSTAVHSINLHAPL